MACTLRPDYLNVGAYIKADDRWLIEGQVWCDAASELPGIDYFDGKRLVQGSMAYVIETGDLYVLKGSGTWAKK